MYKSRYNRTFGGVKAQHSASTYEHIDAVMASCKAQRIVELGSADGALSMYLGIVGKRLGIPVYTIDNVQISDQGTMNVLKSLGVYFLQIDILKKYGYSPLRSLVSDVPVYLICDNGNKVFEFKTFCGMLLDGSAISVHDWMYEISQEHVQTEVDSYKLRPFMEEAWTANGLDMATWLVVDHGATPLNNLSESPQWRSGTESNWHQQTVGGGFFRAGLAQLKILKTYGLEAHHKLLDVGCGSLRLGVQAIEYLDSGNYYGIDCDNELLKVGIEKELKTRSGLSEKNPSFCVNDSFDTSDFINVEFDFVMANSVFTHLSPPAIEKCLEATSKKMKVGGKFLATYNTALRGVNHFGLPYPQMTRYRFDLFEIMAAKLGLIVDNIGGWGIRQNVRGDQLLMIFTKIR